MFTGLIDEIGRLESINTTSGTPRIRVSSPKLAPALKTGDSISVNGVCLTALNITSSTFEADLAHETVQRTTLATRRLGAPVNLELPVRAGTPLGGHIVQGHVDGIGLIVAFEKIGEDWKLTVELPADLERYAVEKGSITLDGISLTVALVTGKHLTVAVIPHTYQATNLHALRPGDPVNVEIDVLAKYAEKRIAAGRVTVERLIQQGF